MRTLLVQPTQQLNASLQSLFQKRWLSTMTVGAANKGIGTVTKYPIDIWLSLFDTWRGAPHILIPFEVFSIDNTDERSQWQQWRWDFGDMIDTENMKAEDSQARGACRFLENRLAPPLPLSMTIHNATKNPIH